MTDSTELTELHENLRREEDIKASSPRGFGITFAVVFAVVALWPLLRGETVRIWAVVASGAFALAALVVPNLLEQPSRLWHKFGLILHRIMSPIALGIIFFGAVLPTALVLRLMGKDLLRLKRDPAASSYWIPRTPSGPPPDSLKNQF